MTRLSLLVALLATACAQPAHLQATWGLSTTEAFQRQADLDRPGAQQPPPALTGEEGLALRARVAEATTDTEAGTTVRETE